MIKLSGIIQNELENIENNQRHWRHWYFSMAKQAGQIPLPFKRESPKAVQLALRFKPHTKDVFMQRLSKSIGKFFTDPRVIAMSMPHYRKELGNKEMAGRAVAAVARNITASSYTILRDLLGK